MPKAKTKTPERIEPDDAQELFRLQWVADKRAAEYNEAKKASKDLKDEAEGAANEVFSFLRELAGGQKRLPMGEGGEDAGDGKGRGEKIDPKTGEVLTR